MEDRQLMTKQEYEASLREWAASVRREQAGILKARTHGKGELEKIKVTVKETWRYSSHYVGFNFKRYGVFVTYGVGRGWVRQNGTVVRGSRVKKGSADEALLKGRGYTKKDIKSYVLGGSGGKGRQPVDWFDSVLLKRVDELGDIAAAYYGDYSMDRLLEMVNRMTIGKRKDNV